MKNDMRHLESRFGVDITNGKMLDMRGTRLENRGRRRSYRWRTGGFIGAECVSVFRLAVNDGVFAGPAIQLQNGEAWT
jgi:hypothetical protein